MAEAIYATAADVKPLIGNLSAQRDNTTIDNAIASATSEVNLGIGRTTTNLDDTTTSPVILNTVKKITRYLAAVELLTGVQSQETTRQQLQKDAQALLDKLVSEEQTEDIGAAFVEMSDPVTYPANDSGIIYSEEYVGLKKGPRTPFYNQYYHDFVPI
jgi:hypothetical protein